MEDGSLLGRGPGGGEAIAALHEPCTRGWTGDRGVRRLLRRRASLFLNTPSLPHSSTPPPSFMPPRSPSVILHYLAGIAVRRHEPVARQQGAQRARLEEGGHPGPEDQSGEQEAPGEEGEEEAGGAEDERRKEVVERQERRLAQDGARADLLLGEQGPL